MPIVNHPTRTVGANKTVIYLWSDSVKDINLILKQLKKKKKGEKEKKNEGSRIFQP